jgi:hypothetical protein
MATNANVVTNPDTAAFEYVNLNEIDPRQAKLPTGVYTLKILKAEFVKGISKAKGTEYTCASFAFAVTNDETFTGRRLFERFFPGNFGLKAMRRIMDATGVQQVPGTHISEWLTELQTLQPEFKVMVQLIEDPRGEAGPDGTVDKVNKINWFEVQPA